MPLPKYLLYINYFVNDLFKRIHSFTVEKRYFVLMMTINL